MMWHDKHARRQRLRDTSTAAKKHKRRKGRFLKGPSGYWGGGKINRTFANRTERHLSKQELHSDVDTLSRP